MQCWTNKACRSQQPLCTKSCSCMRPWGCVLGLCLWAKPAPANLPCCALCRSDCCLAAALHTYIRVLKVTADRLTLWAIQSCSGNLSAVNSRTAIEACLANIVPPGDCSAEQTALASPAAPGGCDNKDVLSVPLPLRDDHLCLSCHAAGCNGLSA